MSVLNIKRIDRLENLIYHPPADPDLYALYYVLCTVEPYSRLWRNGTIRAIRRAIRLIKKENKEKQNGQH